MSTDKKIDDAGQAAKNTGTPSEAGNAGNDKQVIIAAHNAAEADIEEDPDMGLPTEEDDLDEGELANLEGDGNDIV